MLSLIPWPYRLLALCALASALLLTGYVGGLRHEQAAEATQTVRVVEAARRVEQRQAAVTAQVDQVHAVAAARTQIIYETITKEVDHYATNDPGAVMRLDAAWVREHNAAAAGQLPGVPDATGGPDAGAASATAADALAAVAGNYETCNEVRRQLIDLQGWVNSQQTAR